MIRLNKVSTIAPKASKDVKKSRIGLGFEKLDRDVFDPEKAYPFGVTRKYLAKLTRIVHICINIYLFSAFSYARFSSILFQIFRLILQLLYFYHEAFIRNLIGFNIDFSRRTV